MQIDYDTLLQEYNDSLHTKLRNFSVGHEFLELWVPDEDPTKSLFGILDAAQMGQVTEPIEVRVSKETAAAVNLTELKASAEKIATFQTKSTDDGFLYCFGLKAASTEVDSNATGSKVRDRIINIVESDRRSTIQRTKTTVVLAGSSDSFEVDPVYKEHLEATSRCLQNEGAVTANGSTQTIVAKNENGVLSALTDSSGRVVEAKHEKAKGITRVLLDGLCEVLKGRPIQEGSDHGILRLEASLRDPLLSRPVPGIITPENGDAMFAEVTELVRELYRAYRAATKKEAPRNFWSDPESKTWLELSDDVRREKVQSVVDRECERQGWGEYRAQVIGIKNERRIVLAFDHVKGKPSFSHQLIKLEKLIKAALDPQLEIIQESREDRNRREQRNPPPAQMAKGRSAADPTGGG